jgi:hypothetical protein
MAPTDPTVEITINDVFNRLGAIESGIGRLWDANNATNTRLAVLDATLTMRCAQHQKDIDAVAEQNRANGLRIDTIETKVNSAEARIGGGITVGKIAIAVIIWIATTFGAAVTAGYITVSNIHAAPAAQQTQP